MSRMKDHFLNQQELEAIRREIGYESREDYEARQDALPPHKRDGYAERMADYADHLNDLRQGR